MRLSANCILVLYLVGIAIFAKLVWDAPNLTTTLKVSTLAVLTCIMAAEVYASSWLFRQYDPITDPDHDQIMVAIGEASMCWESPELAGAFDADLAVEIGERLRKHFADRIGDFATARRRMCDDLAKDDGLYLAYVSNIRCLLADNIDMSPTECQNVATKLMNLLFETQEKK